jgi:hypothetical protein
VARDAAALPTCQLEAAKAALAALLTHLLLPMEMPPPKNCASLLCTVLLWIDSMAVSFTKQAPPFASLK